MEYNFSRNSPTLKKHQILSFKVYLQTPCLPEVIVHGPDSVQDTYGEEKCISPAGIKRNPALSLILT